jgi:hypothetical protein
MIEQLARSSAEELRSGTVADVEAGLADLHVRQARHRRRAAFAAAAALVLAVGLGAGAGVALTRDHQRALTPSQPGPRQARQDPECRQPLVDCLGGRTYRFALVRPVEWALPPGFGANSGTGATPLMVESYRQVSPTAGVTVMERVRASSPDGTLPAQVPTRPQAFVRWVASRPYLTAGKVAQTTLDGHPAWQVRVTLDQDASPGAGLCSARYQCHLITYQTGGVPTGIWGNMAAEYTATHLPGAGTTVVWSWVFTGSTQHLGALEEAVHGVTWPTA